MPEGDSYSETKRVLSNALRDGLAIHGFEQFGSTVYFIRDRHEVRDVVFFQKMRGVAVCVAYGVTTVPETDDWSPGIEMHQWLEDQKFYNCKYVEHAERNAANILDALERDALPWVGRFRSASDITNDAEQGGDPNA